MGLLRWLASHRLLPSVASADTASQDTWLNLKLEAQSRLQLYEEVVSRLHQGKLQPVLLAALDWLPISGRESLARDITDTLEVFLRFFTCLVLCMQATAKTPSTHTSTTESPHEHRRQSAESLFTRLGDPETRTTSFTTDCLERDKHRCVISGSISEAAWEELGSDEGTKWSNLEVHHIIPFSLADYDDKTETETSIVWDTLYRNFPDLRAIIRNSTINSLGNGMTLAQEVHRALQRFDCALQPTDTPNVYVFKTYRKYRWWLRPFADNGAVITLRCADGHEDKDLPRRELLDCHHRLAEILQASDMVEYIDSLNKRWDDVRQGTSGLETAESGMQ